jgi:hypothetical protein
MGTAAHPATRDTAVRGHRRARHQSKDLPVQSSVFEDAFSGKICVCMSVSVSHVLLIKKKHNQIAEVNAISFLEKLMKLW